ncbi:SH3 domain-containing protein [Microlunatus parietis]|uniref:SH3 domain-containing protein n=1 Tax=Microlunatus parietis TaxID=682979 RepID=UPI0015C7EDF7|nr:SH3 domain-containing protein [Microlunatus parietis]
MAYWPQQESVTAEPPIPSSATPLTDSREDRPDRSTDRPSTPPTTADKAAKEKAAKEKAAKEKAAKQKAADKKAAEEQAAKDKAAKEKAEQEAAEKKAQEKESDGDSEGAGSQKSGDGSEKSGKSGDSEEKSGDSGSEDAYRAPTDWEEVGDRYVTTALNLRLEPSPEGKILKVLPEGEKVTATSTEERDYTLVIYSGEPRWLATEYLSKTKPEPREDDGGDSSGDDGFSSEPCPSGSGVEDGLTKDAIRVHRAICHRFPSITDYGGVRAAAYGYHGSGRALDAMVDGDLGWEVARWVRANAKELGVMEVIYSQKIWTVQRSSEGWRSMEDRGSATANHYDHVHVSVYGNEGTG